MIMLDDTTALVSTAGALADALSNDNGVEYVYFDENITMTSGIRVHPAKSSLVIDGHYPPESTAFHTLADAGNGGEIYINASPNLSITFQNLIISGRSLYGTPYVHNYANAPNVTVIYQNVTYSGPQMIYHQQGVTRFLGCDITITSVTGATGNELGEICKAEIGGLTTIQKLNDANAVFWFYGNSTRRPYLKILSGAEVTITTAHYFMFESSPPDYIIEPGASFTLNTSTGIAWDSGHTVSSFTVGENAVFRYTQTANRGYATLYLGGALTVGDGATFYMQADFANSYPLIQFTAAGGLYLNNPASFALYNRGGTAAFLFSALTPFVFAGNQVNSWETPKEFPVAGTFDDEPRYKWHKPGYAQLRIEGTAGSSQTSVGSHNFTPEELDPLPPFSDLKLYQANVFSTGNLPLSVNAVIIGTRPITGKTAKKAKVRVIRNAVGPYPDRDADDTGRFTVAQTDPMTFAEPFAEMFSIAANTPFLITALAVESQVEGLSIIEAPEYLSFIAPPIAEFADIVLRRNIQNATVTVSDTRTDKTEWVIWVKTAGPLSTEEKDILHDAVVFAGEQGSLTTLGTEFVPIHTDGPYLEDENIPVTWEENRGVLARITVPIRSGRKYLTQLGWIVLPTGVQPQGGE